MKQLNWKEQILSIIDFINSLNLFWALIFTQITTRFGNITCVITNVDVVLMQS